MEDFDGGEHIYLVMFGTICLKHKIIDDGAHLIMGMHESRKLAFIHRPKMHFQDFATEICLY